MATPTQIRRRGRFSLILGTLVAALMVGAVAFASDANVTSIVDATAPTGSVTLAAGGEESITINMTVTGRQENPASFKVYKTWTLSGGTFTGSDEVTFNVNPQVAGTTTNFSTRARSSFRPVRPSEVRSHFRCVRTESSRLHLLRSESAIALRTQ